MGIVDVDNREVVEKWRDGADNTPCWISSLGSRCDGHCGSMGEVPQSPRWWVIYFAIGVIICTWYSARWKWDEIRQNLQWALGQKRFAHYEFKIADTVHGVVILLAVRYLAFLHTASFSRKPMRPRSSDMSLSPCRRSPKTHHVKWEHILTRTIVYGDDDIESGAGNRARSGPLLGSDHDAVTASRGAVELRTLALGTEVIIGRHRERESLSESLLSTQTPEEHPKQAPAALADRNELSPSMVPENRPQAQRAIETRMGNLAFWLEEEIEKSKAHMSKEQEVWAQ